MDMEVRNRLTGRFAIVNPNVEAVRSINFLEFLSRYLQKLNGAMRFVHEEIE